MKTPAPRGKVEKVGSVMVIGGGIAGMQSALDMAACGLKVYIVEQKPGIGGVMSQLDKTFPTNDCAMCTMAPRLVEIGRHKDIEIISNAEVERVEGTAGRFTVTVAKKPRYIDEAACTGCGACVTSCPVRTRVQPPVVRPAPGAPEVIEEEYRARTVNIVDRHRYTWGPLMPILQEVNKEFNYFPEGVLKYVSGRTGYSLAHVYRIATFYGAFSVKPKGRHTVNVCMGTACYIRGAERILDKFRDALGIDVDGTTPDRRVTLKRVRCLGCCGLAPVLMVGTAVHGRLTIADVPKVIGRYGEPARGGAAIPGAAEAGAAPAAAGGR